MMLTLIIAEAALETAPIETWSHHAVKRFASLKGKAPGEVLLDRSYHHSAMKWLKDAGRRGRPDIIHFSLLEAASSPLYIKERLKLYVHTCRDKVVEVGRRIHLPKTYARFEGLFEQLFKQGEIPSRRKVLLKLRPQSFQKLVKEVKPSIVIGLSRIGEKSSCEEVARKLTSHKSPAVVVGGFPRGHFSKQILTTLDGLYSVHELPLESHVVIARIIYEYEKQIEP